MKLLARKNQGFTIIELLIVISVIGFITILNIQAEKKSREDDNARYIGRQLSIYNNAVRSHISVNLDNQDYIDNVETTLTGVDWLKSADQCGGSANGYFLPCEFPEFIGDSNLTYTTTIFANIGDGKLRAKTVIDVKTADGSTTHIGSTQLGLALLNATGGERNSIINLDSDDTTMQIDGDGNASTNVLLTNTDGELLYCPFGLDVAFLNPECSIDGVVVEDGLIVMISETAGERDNLLRVDGSNTMKNKLRMDAAESAQREIVGSSTIYNLTGEVLKLGNSGIYFDDGWIPVIGDGLAIDTDFNVVGNTKIKGDLDNAGDVFANTSLMSERAILAGREVIIERDAEVVGDQFVLGDANYNDNVVVFGTVDAIMANSNTFVEANEVSALNNISSDTIINAPVIRSSSGMFSDGGIVASGDKLVTGDSYVRGNRAITGDVVTSGDVIADNGTAYLGNVFASALFDPDGDFLIDPSGISRTNITRAESIVSSTSGSKLGLNGNRILFAREDISCTSASQECATKVGGYVDMEDVMIKSPGDGSWIGFVDYLNGLETYIEDQSNVISDIASTATIELPDDISGWSCDGSTRGVKLPRSEALDAERDYGWNCTSYPDYVFEGEEAYVCSMGCGSPSPPSGSICEAPGYLSDTVTVNGSSNIPNDWNCSSQGTVGGVDVYECSVPCRLPDPPCVAPDYLEDKGWYSECVSPPDDTETP